MDDQVLTAANLYARIATEFVSDPALEQALLADFQGTVADRFHATFPKPIALSRTATGFCLTYDGQSFDLGDPRNAAKGELNDAELELVSGGGGPDCPEKKSTDDSALFSSPELVNVRHGSGT